MIYTLSDVFLTNTVTLLLGSDTVFLKMKLI